MAGSYAVVGGKEAQYATLVDAAGNPVGTMEGIALASAARTGTTTSPDIVNNGARGIVVFLNVSSAGASGGLTLRVSGKDPASGNYAAINTAPTAVTAAGTTVYVIYPGASGGGAAQATNAPLPRTFRILVTHADGASYTYSVAYCLIP